MYIQLRIFKQRQTHAQICNSGEKRRQVQGAGGQIQYRMHWPKRHLRKILFVQLSKNQKDQETAERSMIKITTQIRNPICKTINIQWDTLWGDAIVDSCRRLLCISPKGSVAKNLWSEEGDHQFWKQLFMGTLNTESIMSLVCTWKTCYKWRWPNDP